MKQMYRCHAEGWFCSVLLQPQIWSRNGRKKGKNLNTQVTGDGIGREERGATLRTEKRYGTDKERKKISSANMV